MANPTYFIDDVAKAARAAEVPNADFEGGMNYGGSCACGLGINQGGGAVVGTPEQFTLLDQHGDARNAQISQHIGGSGLAAGSIGTLPDAVIRHGTNDAGGSGEITSVANSSLVDLAVGWEDGPV